MRLDTIVCFQKKLGAPEVMPVQEEEFVPESEGNEKEYELSFTVWGTLPRLKAVKAFLVEGGYRFE